MFKKIKAVTHRHHNFLKAAYKYDNLIDLHNDERFIYNGEKFIRFADDRWLVYKMNKARQPRLCGRFDNIISAVSRARLTV